MQDAIINAVNTLIDGKLKKLKFNYYVDGVIYAVTNNSYTVTINGVQYTNVLSKQNIDYSVGDKVQILVKNGDWNKKIIDDKYKPATFVGTFATEAELETALNNVLTTMSIGQVSQIRFSIAKIGEVTIGDWWWIGTLYKSSSANYAILEASSGFGSKTSTIKKSLSYGTWMPFEWENPPLDTGIEYRTTKRFNGSAVYIKVIDCGDIPVNGGKTIAHNITNCKPISCTGRAGGNLSVPYTTAGGNKMGISAHSTSIIIHTDYESSAKGIVAILEYCKG